MRDTRNTFVIPPLLAPFSIGIPSRRPPKTRGYRPHSSHLRAIRVLTDRRVGGYRSPISQGVNEYNQLTIYH